MLRVQMELMKTVMTVVNVILTLIASNVITLIQMNVYLAQRIIPIMLNQQKPVDLNVQMVLFLKTLLPIPTLVSIVMHANPPPIAKPVRKII